MSYERSRANRQKTIFTYLCPNRRRPSTLATRHPPLAFLREEFRILKEKPDAEFAFSVTSYAFPIFRAIRVAENGRVEMFWPENQMKRSQDLPEAWHDAGQFYLGRKSAFLENEGVFTARSYPVILPRHLVQDIDTPEDWDRAERMFQSI
jgi:pseudaminic acid cytidylyltransferase